MSSSSSNPYTGKIPLEIDHIDGNRSNNKIDNLRIASQALESRSHLFLPLNKSTIAIARADELLQEFGLTDSREQLAGALSHGQQRRLEIAVTLATRPKLLLLDEPTQGMSRGDTQETAELIKHLGSKITVLLIEHDVDLVMDLSKKVIVMAQGKKLAEGNRNFCMDTEKLEALLAK
jgi:branched-chain amino acid transport system ATP-binding protein